MWTFALYQKHDSKTKFWGIGFGLSQTAVFCVKIAVLIQTNHKGPTFDL
jgi:hypothetical protein